MAPNAQLAAPTLEAWQQELATLASAERACWWTIGDTILFAIRAAGAKKARAGIYRAAGSILHCSAQTVRIMATAAATFGKDQRHQDVPPSVYRAVVQVARRLNRPAIEVLGDVLESNLGVLAVLAIGTSEHEMRRRHGQCGECGARWAVTAAFPLADVVCGYCVGRLRADGLLTLSGEAVWPSLVLA